MKNSHRTGVLLLALLVSSGCAKSDWKVKTIPVTGSVSLNGEAHAGILVILFSRGEDVDVSGSRPWGMTDEQGQYSLSTYEKGDGCPVGEYTITLKWPVDPGSKSDDRLKGKYSSPNDSQWTASINETTTQLSPIELTNVKFAELTESLPSNLDGTGVRRKSSR